MNDSKFASVKKAPAARSKQIGVHPAVAGAALLLLTLTAIAQPSTVWTICDSIPTANNLSCVAGAEGLFAAVGDSGTIISSRDAQKWVKRNVPTKLPLRSVAFSESLFVAVGDSGMILTSPDCSVWTNRSAAVTAALHGVAWTGKKFVAVGTGGTIVISSDGTEWTSVDSKTLKDLKAVTMTDTEVVAVGSAGAFLRSSEGTRWDTVPNLGGNLTFLTWSGKELFVGISGAVGILSKSPQSIRIVWCYRIGDGSKIGDLGLTAIAADNDQLLVGVWLKTGLPIPNEPIGGRIFASTDFPIWSQASTKGYSTLVSFIAITKNKYIAVGAQGYLTTCPKQLFVQELCQ
jgi:hypothetical protein